MMIKKIKVFIKKILIKLKLYNIINIMIIKLKLKFIIINIMIKKLKLKFIIFNIKIKNLELVLYILIIKLKLKLFILINIMIKILIILYLILKIKINIIKLKYFYQNNNNKIIESTRLSMTSLSIVVSSTITEMGSEFNPAGIDQSQAHKSWNQEAIVSPEQLREFKYRGQPMRMKIKRVSQPESDGFIGDLSLFNPEEVKRKIERCINTVFSDANDINDL